MAKKDHAKMEKEKKAFVDGCEKNGISKEKAASVFDVISGFASYAFNKSHGAAYALLAYETAYLKCMYPKEYFAAKLDSEGGHFKETNDYSLELQKLGTKLLPPCINRSAEDFLPCGNGVRYSLSAVKGVGRTIALKIVKEREKNGSFESPDDFISRLGGVVGTNAAVALARVGAFDIFGENRHTLSTLFENTVSGGAFSFHNEDQISLSFDSPEAVKYPRKHMAEYNETQLRIFEKEYTGVDFHFEMGIERKYALYIKLTHENEKALPLALKKLSDDKGASVVRIYDSRTEKTSQLKELFFIPTTLGLEELEQIMGKDNVKLKAL
jgi:DNA polymerase-3 subunit alpha